MCLLISSVGVTVLPYHDRNWSWRKIHRCNGLFTRSRQAGQMDFPTDDDKKRQAQQKAQLYQDDLNRQVCVCVCVHACMRVRVCAHAHASAYVCVLCVHTCKCIVKLGQDMMNSLVCFLKRNLKTMNRSTKSNTYLHHTALNSRRWYFHCQLKWLEFFVNKK